MTHVPRLRLSRKLFTLLATASLLSGSLFVATTALAVNTTGAFELDGNPATQAGVSGNDDADRVCYQDGINEGLTAAAATTRCGIDSGTTGAVAAQWIDSSGSPTIFTGGGSKDPQNPGTDWLWKPKDTVPDKDTIDHVFAARYSLAKSAATCPGQTADLTCEVIYFGVDRFDNSGDAQLGFWFFKSKISLTNVAQSGGFKFSGNHQNGDLLLISQFSNGGTTSTIEAHFWDTSCTKAASSNPTAGQCSGANLRLQQRSTQANCATAAATAPFCGIVNGATTPSTWPYTDKTTGDAPNQYLQGEYYEAGVNLSSLGIGNECFPSFLAESRASTSTTATLKDFTLGNFQNCSAVGQTTPSSSDAAGANGSVSPGSPVTDTMTVTGSGTAQPPFPTSSTTAPGRGNNVFFKLCGPITAPATCTTGGTNVGAATGVPLAATATQGKSSATSAAVNTAANPLAPGRYCFAGSWAGDDNYPEGAADTSSRECFTVIQVGTATVTTPSDSSGTALTGTQPLGSSLYDSAVVTAASNAAGAIAGSVSFFVCTPSQLTGGVCAAGAGTQVGSAVSMTPVASSNPPRATAVSTPAVIANVAGTWCFRATFTPTGSNYTGSNDTGSATECVVVGPENTSTVTTPRSGTSTIPAAGVKVGTSVFDRAVVTATTNSDGTPTGTINFFVCSPSQLSAGLCTTGGTAIGSPTAVAVAASNPPASTADSDPFTVNVVGIWCFRAVYVPGGTNGANYNTSSDSSAGECFTVTPIGTTTVTTPSASSTGSSAITTSQALGTLLYDKAVITAAQAGGGDITGNVTFFVCNPSQLTAGVCAAATGSQVGVAIAVSPVAAANPPQSTAVSSPGVAANQVGTWCFRATFVPTTTNYTGSNDTGSAGECVTINPENTTTVTTPRSGTSAVSGPIAVGSSVFDRAVVTATTNSDGTPTGTINFFLCNPTTVATNGGTCSAGGTAVGSKTAVAVAASNPPASTADSDAATVTSVGTWCFRAVYVPGGANGANYNGSKDDSVGECFTVTDGTTTTSAQNWLPNDSATVTSTGGSPLSGALAFTLYDSADCTGTILYEQDADTGTAGVQPFSFTGATSPVTRVTTNTTVKVSTSKTVSWKVVFASSNASIAGSSHCESTQLTITN